MFCDSKIKIELSNQNEFEKVNKLWENEKEILINIVGKKDDLMVRFFQK